MLDKKLAMMWAGNCRAQIEGQREPLTKRRHARKIKLKIKGAVEKCLIPLWEWKHFGANHGWRQSKKNLWKNV